MKVRMKPVLELDISFAASDNAADRSDFWDGLQAIVKTKGFRAGVTTIDGDRMKVRVVLPVRGFADFGDSATAAVMSVQDVVYVTRQRSRMRRIATTPTQ